MKRNRLVILLINMFFSIALVAMDKPLMFVCEEYPPYEYQVGNSAQGMDIEIIDLVCKHANIPYAIKFYPWERCLKMIKEGNADVIFGILKNKERQGVLDYPEQPVAYDKRILLSKKNIPYSIREFNDLKDKKIGIVRGYAYSSQFDQSTIFSRDISSSSKMMVDKLNANRMETIAINEYVAKFIIGRNQWAEYKVHPFVITLEPLYTAFSKKSVRAGIYFKRYSESMKELEKSGEINKIRNKYR